MAEAAIVRNVRQEDIPAITAIYAHYVLNTSASFETEPPDQAEMNRRRQGIEALGLPYLIAEVDFKIAGYAYAGMYRPRRAYCFTVEDSIYIGPAFTGRGLGRLLLSRLIGDCTALDYRQMVAVIGGSGNAASIALHQRLGFSPAGLLKAVGFKFGRWTDSVLMQRPLGPGDSDFPTPR